MTGGFRAPLPIPWLGGRKAVMVSEKQMKLELYYDWLEKAHEEPKYQERDELSLLIYRVFGTGIRRRRR